MCVFIPSSLVIVTGVRPVVVVLLDHVEEMLVWNKVWNKLKKNTQLHLKNGGQVQEFNSKLCFNQSFMSKQTTPQHILIHTLPNPEGETRQNTEISHIK